MELQIKPAKRPLFERQLPAQQAEDELGTFPCAVETLEAVAVALILKAECGLPWVRVERDPSLRVIAPDIELQELKAFPKVLAAREAIRRVLWLPHRGPPDAAEWKRSSRNAGRKPQGWDTVVHEVASCFFGQLRSMRMLAMTLKESGRVLPSAMDMAASLYLEGSKTVKSGEYVVSADYRSSNLG